MHPRKFRPFETRIRRGQDYVRIEARRRVPKDFAGFHEEGPPIREAFDPRDLEQEQIEPSTDQVLQPARPTGGLTSGEVWRHSIRVKPEALVPGLVTVTVEVSQRRSDGRGQTRFALTRWVRQEQQQDPLGDFGDPFGGDQR